MIYENEYMRYDETTKVLRVKDIIKVFTREIQNTELREDGNPKRCMLLPGMHFYRVVLPDCMERIDNHAFEDMNMSEINIPDGITYIGAGAFSNCTWLEKIYWPKGTKCILRYTFDECEKLEEVILPEGLTTISGNAFQSCKALKNITIPSTVREFGACVFHACESLETINVPRSLYEKYHRDDCYFKSNSSAKVVVYDDSALAWFDFGDDEDDLSSDEELSNEKETTMIYQNEFLSFNPETNHVTVKDGVNIMYSQITMHKLYNCYGDGTELKDEMNYVLFLPDCMERIEELSLSCMNMSEIVIPDSITYIGASAFSCCDWLEKISWPSGVSCINYNTFFTCGQLKKVDLPKGLVAIGDSAFEGCCSLKEMVIPQTVKEFGNDVFKNCDSLETITIPKSLYEKCNRNDEYFKCNTNAEVIVYDEPISTSTNAIEKPKTIIKDTIKTVSSSKKEIKSFNGKIRTNLIANKKNKV